MKPSSSTIHSLLTGLLALGLAPALALAEGSALSPFEAPVVNSASFSEAISGSLKETSRVTVVNPVSQITISSQIQTLGNVTFRFNREWHVPDVSFTDNGFGTSPLSRDGVHLQGTVELRTSAGYGAREKVSVPAAATIFNLQGEDSSVQISFLAGPNSDSANFYQVSGNLKNQSTPQTLKVRRISRQAFNGKTCGVSLSGEALEVQQIKKSALFASSPVRTAAATQAFDLATEADYEWYARYGSGSNTKIQAILNQVQTIYQNQLNLTFNLTKQVALSSNGVRYPSSNVDTLLSSFRAYGEANQHLGDADLFHLFTGKDTFLLDDDGTQNSSVIGLAYLGVVCAFPSYSYGLTEDLDDALNNITTAHEMGHNFNAEHDAAGSIMGTTLNLNNPPTTFSANSKSQIASWVSANSSCLASSGATPGGGGSGSDPGSGDTSHASIGVTLKSNGNFTLTTGFSEVEAGCSAQVHASSTAGGAYEGTVIASPPTDSLSSTFRNIKIPRKVAQYIGNTRRIQKVYFGVVKTCPSGTYYSVTRSISPFKISSSKPALKVGKWISTLAQKASSVVPE